jgi:hypothetical protein
MINHEVANLCKRLRIPVPPRGYWAKAQHGRRPVRAVLRDLPGGVAVEIVIHVPAQSASGPGALCHRV